VVICGDTEDRWDDLMAAVIVSQAADPSPRRNCDGNRPQLKLQRRSTFELPGVKVIPNDNEKGLAGARNAGIAAATADIVAFLHDETVPVHNWLAALVAPNADPYVLGVGGQVAPVWQVGRPGWFPPEFDWVVGCSYRGMPAERALVHHFIGGDMSLRRRIVVECGGFDVALSGIRTRRLACEETERCASA
jgi:glycosyltransferase involved in cell wall biosynthesis